MTEESRAQMIEAKIGQEKDKENPVWGRIPWEDGYERLIVVNLPVHRVLLNARSHRIKAQLASLPEDRRATVQADPTSVEAQDIIAELLRKVDKFEGLKRDLELNQQSEPGVVTREGILVNANTRAVALRDLGKTHIQAMVLPPDAGSDQIAELELRLQVRPDYKSEYTFTNELLFIQDCLSAGWSHERIARERYSSQEKRAVQEVKQKIRLLNMVEELREQSNHRLTYTDFDEASEALVNLDERYEKTKANEGEVAALRVRAARMAAILAGVGYRQIRHIDASFVEEYLRPELEEDDELGVLSDQILGSGEREDEPEGLDLLDGPDVAPGGEEDGGAALLGWLTRTAGHKEVTFTAPEEGDGQEQVTRPRDQTVEALRTVIERAAADARSDARREDRIERPAARVKEAAKKLRIAADAFAEAKTDIRFSEKQLAEIERQLRTVEERRESLQIAINQHRRSSGDART